MKVEIELFIVSLDPLTQAPKLALINDKVPRKVYNSTESTPEYICEEMINRHTDTTGEWLKYKLGTVYVDDNSLVIAYGVLVPDVVSVKHGKLMDMSTILSGGIDEKIAEVFARVARKV